MQNNQYRLIIEQLVNRNPALQGAHEEVFKLWEKRHSLSVAEIEKMSWLPVDLAVPIQRKELTFSSGNKVI